MAEDRPQRVGDVAWIQQPGGHLVEQRREEVVVVLVQQNHIDGLAVERAGAGEAAKPGADDHDAWTTPTLTLPRKRGRESRVSHRSRRAAAHGLAAARLPPQP